MADWTNGRTKRQILRAPQGTLYVWPQADTSYVRALAIFVDRDDLVFVAPSWLTPRNVVGRDLPSIVVDHAAIPLLTTEQWECIHRIRQRASALRAKVKAPPETVPSVIDQKPTFELELSKSELGELIDKAMRCQDPALGQTVSYKIARLAFATGVQVGADAELDACCEHLNRPKVVDGEELRHIRRPKPLSLRQKAKNALALAQREAGKGGKIYDGSPFFELRDLIEELPDA